MDVALAVVGGVVGVLIAMKPEGKRAVVDRKTKTTTFERGMHWFSRLWLVGSLGAVGVVVGLLLGASLAVG